MNKILYIHQYFLTPDEPGANRSYWVARSLVRSGYRVVIITAKSNLKKKIFKKSIDGIEVIYLKISYNQKMNIFSRFIAFFKFMLLAAYHAFKVQNIDLVISTSTPLSVGLPAILLKKIKKIPYIFEVRDLWPEVPIQMGGVRNKFIIKLLRYFELSIYRNSKHIVALSPGIRTGILNKGVEIDKISTIYNMSKVDIFWKRKVNKSLLKDLNLKLNTFKCIHFGSLGEANDASYIIKAAILLKDQKDINFIFVGGGSHENKLKSLCKENNLKNVFFLGSYPMKLVSEIVNFCDVSLVVFKNLPILYTNSPNKFFDSLSAEKPIIVNSNGWTRELVEDNYCGFYADPDEPYDLANKILFLKENKAARDEMGINSRRLAMQTFDKKILCNKYVNLVNKLVRK